MQTTNNQTIRAALESLIPQFAAYYAGWLRKVYSEMAAEEPTIKTGRVPSTSRNYRTFWNLIHPLMTPTEAASAANAWNPARDLDEAKAIAAADKWARETALAWEGKIMEKVGDLSDVSIRSYDSDHFNISGRRADGREVTIIQSRIINCRYARGSYTVFNQFPALIYVDGKRVSAAQYKTL